MFLVFLIAMIWNTSYANNLQITNVTKVNNATISFKVNWENSWRVSTAPKNHDAVWIFIKRIDCATNQWNHVDLSPSAGNHYADDPLEIYIDGRDGALAAKGVFIRRKTDGVGHIANDSISLNIINMPAGEFDFEVFGIEMVQIPQGAFYLGDGVSGSSFKSGTTNDPYRVTSESIISTTSLSALGFVPVALPANYPKGFKEIYCMKYEITQGQYIGFLNALLYDQALVRTVPPLTGNRFAYTGTWPNYVSTTPHRAMINMMWDDIAAYLDWVALRPMTELEFEKIARGPIYPVGGEYAWGNTSITKVTGTSNDGSPSESASNTAAAGHGIATYSTGGPLGPLRTGFAAKPGTNRVSSGASYYGVMDLSSNALESVVGTTHTASVTAFTARMGDGEISTTPAPGLANVTGWPSYLGGTNRGGAWNTTVNYLSISMRNQPNSLNDGTTKYPNVGGRGVR